MGVIANIEEKLNLQLSLVDIFTAPTVAQLTAKLKSLSNIVQMPAEQVDIEQTHIDEQLSDQELDALLAAMDSEES